MADSLEAEAKVELRDGLVCITITSPGAPETVLRMPGSLAREMAKQIDRIAGRAPAAWPTDAGSEQ